MKNNAGGQAVCTVKRLIVGLTVAAVGSTFADDFTYPGTFAPAAGDHIVCEFPSGTFSDATETKITHVRTGDNSVTLKGTNTTWTMPSGNTYSTTPFTVSVDGSAMTFTSSATTESPLKFENFNFRSSVKAGASSDTAQYTALFDGGSYNFFDPEGTVHSALPTLAFTSSKTLSSYEVIFSNATTRLPPTSLSSTKVDMNRIRFVGGSHTIYGNLAKSGTDLTVQLGGGASREYEFIVSDAATVTLGGEFRFAANKRALLRVEGNSTMDFGGGSQRYMANSTSTPWTFSVDHSTIKSTGQWQFGGYANRSNHGILAMTNSVVGFSGKLAAVGDLDAEFVDCAVSVGDFSLGSYAVTAGTKTRLAFKGTDATTTFTGDFYVGNATYATVNEVEFAGGTHTISSSAAKFFIGRYAGYGDKNTVIISGGTVQRTNAAFTLGNGADTSADLVLTGGTLYTTALIGSSGATTTLTANGGTLKAYSAGTVISGIATATIGDGGFTIDTNGKSVTVNQSFGGTGALTVTGGGTVTFASGVTIPGALVVAGGTTVVFGDTFAPTSLTLGKDGTTCPITLPYGRTMAIAGDLDANVFQLAFTGGTYEKSTELREIFRVSGTLIGDTATAWKDSRATAGVSSEGAFDASVTEDAGVQVLGFKVRDPITVTVAVPDGEAVVTNKKIKVCSGDTLVFDVGEGGSFASDYPVVSGAILVKRGEGTLTLGNANNNFASVTNEEGTIVLKDPNALGGLTVPISGDGIVYDFATPGETASTFTICKQYSNEAIRVEVPTADVTMPLYDILNGGLVKDGPGAVSFLMPDKNVRLSTVSATPWKGNKQGDAGVKIRQGELAFRGRTETIRELTYTDMGPVIGVTNDLGVANPAAPKLVFDHINFAAARVTPTFCAVGVKSAGPAHLIATNHATVAMNSINVGSTTASSTDKAYVTIDDNSILRFSYRLTALPNGGMVYFDVDNNSALQIASTDLRGNVDMTFRNGSKLCNNSGGLLSLAYGVADHTTSFRFESGAKMLVSYIGESGKDKTSLQSICKLLFDGGEWCPGTDTVTLGFTRITGELAVKGTGLILAPTSAQTWTIGTPIVDSTEGAGGFVKRGEGTVILDAANLKYTGVTRLEAGTLDLNGSTAEGVTIQPAGGTIANGSLVKPTYKLEVTDEGQAETKATIDPSVVSGVVTFDLGRTAENPLTLPVAAFEVATYTGDTAPDVSRWKVTGAGRADAVATLTIDQDTKKIKVAVSQLEGFFLFLQ